MSTGHESIKLEFRAASAVIQFDTEEAFHTTDRDLFAQFGRETPVILAQYISQVFWRAAPLADIDAWLTPRVPKELATAKKHYMDWARLRLAERATVVPAMDRQTQAPPVSR